MRLQHWQISHGTVDASKTAQCKNCIAWEGVTSGGSPEGKSVHGSMSSPMRLPSWKAATSGRISSMAGRGGHAKQIAGTVVVMVCTSSVPDSEICTTSILQGQRKARQHQCSGPAEGVMHQDSGQDYPDKHTFAMEVPAHA